RPLAWHGWFYPTPSTPVAGPVPPPFPIWANLSVRPPPPIHSTDRTSHSRNSPRAIRNVMLRIRIKLMPAVEAHRYLSGLLLPRIKPQNCPFPKPVEIVMGSPDNVQSVTSGSSALIKPISFFRSSASLFILAY